MTSVDSYVRLAVLLCNNIVVRDFLSPSSDPVNVKVVVLCKSTTPSSPCLASTNAAPHTATIKVHCSVVDSQVNDFKDGNITCDGCSSFADKVNGSS
ncbi:hypothetical protein E2C01_062904 [Portunus trituberculatus]|uniref:Uncharacterized protein n=1 Tax=Portunus trituberculatus TaxID=210409 RepID=A0A5B7H955_PORTR|nr:hypothetical protein [Portunus trituberculatus]